MKRSSSQCSLVSLRPVLPKAYDAPVPASVAPHLSVVRFGVLRPVSSAAAMLLAHQGGGGGAAVEPMRIK